MRLPTLADITEPFESGYALMWKQLAEWRDSKNSRNVLQEIKRYIDEHFSNPNLSLTILSEEFHLHHTSISRLFKEEFGVKFIDYINAIRIEESIRLMKTSECTVQEIAEKVGYVQSQTFIKMFKKITGGTPGLFRKEKLNKGDSRYLF